MGGILVVNKAVVYTIWVRQGMKLVHHSLRCESDQSLGWCGLRAVGVMLHRRGLGKLLVDPPGYNHYFHHKKELCSYSCSSSSHPITARRNIMERLIINTESFSYK